MGVPEIRSKRGLKTNMSEKKNFADTETCTTELGLDMHYRVRARHALQS